jgi:hypothetical protein
MKKSTLKRHTTSKKASKRKASKSALRAPKQQNEGEGSRSAARSYNAGAVRAASNPKRVEELAKKAKRAVDGSEGKRLRAAEEIGKRGRPR